MMRNKSIAIATLMAAASGLGMAPVVATPTPRWPEPRKALRRDEEIIAAAQVKRDRKAAKRLAAQKNGGT